MLDSIGNCIHEFYFLIHLNLKIKIGEFVNTVMMLAADNGAVTRSAVNKRRIVTEQEETWRFLASLQPPAAN